MCRDLLEGRTPTKMYINHNFLVTAGVCVRPALPFLVVTTYKSIVARVPKICFFSCFILRISLKVEGCWQNILHRCSTLITIAVKYIYELPCGVLLHQNKQFIVYTLNCENTILSIAV